MFTIGELARQAQVTTKNIRFYEQEGLIAPTGKTTAGYRLYTEQAVRRLGFIKHAQDCGFALSEIRQLLELRTSRQSCCDAIYRVAIEKKLQIERRIKSLKMMSEALSQIIERCSRDASSVEHCQIVEALEASRPGRDHIDSAV